jgi:hypothetical protein
VNEDDVTVGPAGRTDYRCVTGHPIPAGALDSLTEVVSLDGGAVVRQCCEHGAPIAILISPPAHA